MIPSFTFPKIEFPAIELLKNFSKELRINLDILADNLIKISENHQDGKEIRGEIITSVIDLEEKLSEIILKAYISEPKKEEFLENVLLDRNFPISLKKDIVNRTGLLDGEPALKKDIELLITIRNLVAHSRYRPTIEEVMVFDVKNDKIENISDLKKKFDGIFGGAMRGLDKVLGEIKNE